MPSQTLPGHIRVADVDIDVEVKVIYKIENGYVFVKAVAVLDEDNETKYIEVQQDELDALSVELSALNLEH